MKIIGLILQTINGFGLIGDFTESGYIKDDEAIDADELLKGLKESNKVSNIEREKLRVWKNLPFGVESLSFYNKLPTGSGRYEDTRW